MFDPLRFQNLHGERLLEAQVEKDNFHQFNSDFHKEKEMVDFRKWVLALAVVGLMLGVGSSAAVAQVGGNSFTCAATAVPNIVRAEGITELMGDLILNCTGGTPTAAGLPIPLENVVITIGGTNITSRIVGSTSPSSNTYNASEALLLIDEPYPATPYPANGTKDVTNPALNQLACLANNNTNCAITSAGVGVGAAGSYNGTAQHYNVFQGSQQGANSISWSGVPIDAPGTAGTRVIRITNIRADVTTLAVGSTLIPTTVSESIFVNGTNIIALNQASNGSVVANVVPGLVQTVGSPAGYQQCNSVNTYLLGSPNTIVTDSGVTVSATEGFRFSFKPQNYAQVIAAQNGAYQGPGNPLPQDVLNFPYDTESGFTPDASLVAGSIAAFPGYASQGTQIQFAVTGVSAGVTLYAPSYVYLTGAYGTGTIVGVAVLTSQGGVTVSGTAPPLLLAGNAATAASEVALSTSANTSTLVYEIWYSDPSVLETLSVPISVEYVSNTASNIPATTSAATPSKVAAGFSPQVGPHTASTSAPIPRFIQDTTSTALFTISPCSCNLLFPFVTNIAGFDTGVAIANTSMDPFGTSSQTGTVVLNYYGSTSGGGAAPPATVPLGPVPAGQELIFTLSNGGNYSTPATPGFEGYIIAQANFQYCHGFAFISDVGAQKLAEGYLAISLDVPVVTVNVALPTGLNRTGNAGENEGH
jgi:hypothetical protein